MSKSSPEIGISSQERNELITEWYRLYGEELRVYAWSLTQRYDLVDDVIQITMLKALENFRLFDLNRSPIAYLLTILRNTVIDIYRSRKSGAVSYDDRFHTRDRRRDERTGILDELLEAEYSTVVADLPNALQRDDLRSYLTAEQESVLPVILGEESYEEIAARLSISYQVARKRVQRARAAIRKRVEEIGLSVLV